MKPKPHTSITLAGLLTAASWLAAPNLQAVIVGPYAPDALTLHLYHFDETATPVVDYATTGATNLTSLQNGATLGNAAAAGFGNALNTYDGGPTGTAAADKDAVITCRGTGNAATLAYANPTTGAFTYEALVRVGFDPAQSENTVANGGTGRNSPMQIINCEAGGGSRVFQFRLDPTGINPGATGAGYTNNLAAPVLEFIKIASPTEWIVVPIPMTGPDAIASNEWYHVAITYSGSPNTPENVKIYWTHLDASRTSATLIGSATLTNSLSPVSPNATTFAIGNGGRSQNANFVGLIDEVRISSVARSADGMLFSPPVKPVAIDTQPQSVFAAEGDYVQLSVSASGSPAPSYQWQYYGTNLPNATSAALVFSTITPNQAGPYRVIVSNSVNNVTSEVATVRVGRLFRGLYNTGVNDNRALLAGGEVDPHWQLVQSGDPVYPGPAAVIVGSPPATYMANGPGSMWLAPVASGSAAGQALFTYRTTFLIDTMDPTNAVLTGGWAMDNTGIDILLNGQSVGLSASGFGVLTPFTITNGNVHTIQVDDGSGNLVDVTITNHFVLGLNTLDVVISNAPSSGANPTGLRVEVRGVSLPLPAMAPLFTELPVNVSTQAQQSASFSATAVGSAPLTYQWFHGATLLTDQTNRTLVLPNLSTADAGVYSVWVTNSVGFTNASATLTVLVPATLAWLGNNSANPGAWDTLTPNWLETSSSAVVPFSPAKNVLFDSRGSTQPTVNLAEPLSPNALLVDADTDYYLTSFGANGWLTGPATLTKKGNGVLVLDTPNTHSGPTLILAGTVQVGNGDTAGSLGTGTVSNNATLLLNRIDTFPVPNAISGTGTVSVTSSGTAVVSGHNTYTGPTVIQSGTLSANNAAALGSTNTGTTVNNGAQLFIFGDVTLDPEPLRLDGYGPGTGALRKGSGAATTFGGAISLADASSVMINLDNSATLNLTNTAGLQGKDTTLSLNGGSGSQGTVAGPVALGAGALTKDGAGTWTLLATNNSWTGGLNVNAGTLLLGDGRTNCSFGTGPININPGAALTYNNALSYVITNDLLNNGTNTFNGNGNPTLTGAVQNYGVLTFNTSSNQVISGTLLNAGTLTFNSPGVPTLPAAIQNDGSLLFNTADTRPLTPILTGGGSLTLRGSSVFRASTNDHLGAGTCTIGAAQTDTGRLELLGGITLVNPIAIFPRVFFGTGPGGTTDVAADILNVGGTNTLSPPSSIVIGAGGNNLTLQSDAGRLVLNAGVTASGSGRHLVLRGAGAGEILGALDRSGANSQYLWKLDAGTWTLSGTNTPGAPLTISNGVLVLNGSLDTNILVAGGTLAGQGLVAGAVAVNAGATLSPGPGLGALTINGDLTFQPGSFMAVELNRASGLADQVLGLTSVTYGGTLTVTNLAGTLAAGDAFKLFDATVYSGAFAGILPAVPAAGLAWNTNTLAVDGTLRITSGVVASRTNLVATLLGDGSGLQLSWPADHTGWTLQVQTNSLATGLSTNWVTVPGSTGTNQVTFPFNRANGTVFYRLALPVTP